MDRISKSCEYVRQIIYIQNRSEAVDRANNSKDLFVLLFISIAEMQRKSTFYRKR